MEGLFLIQCVYWTMGTLLSVLAENQLTLKLSALSLFMAPFLIVNPQNSNHFQLSNVLFISYLTFWSSMAYCHEQTITFSGMAFFVNYTIWIYVTCQYESKLRKIKVA